MAPSSGPEGSRAQLKALNPRSKVFSPSAYSHGGRSLRWPKSRPLAVDDDVSNEAARSSWGMMRWEASQMSGLYGAGLTGYQGYSSFDSHWQHEVTEATVGMVTDAFHLASAHSFQAPRSFGKGGKAR